MRPSWLLPLAAGVLVLAAGLAAAAEPDKDPAVAALLEDARKWLESREPAAVVGLCDRVDAIYRKEYGSRKEKIYCASNPTESLAMLLEATTRKENAIVIGPSWAAAHFLKAYALVELRKPAEARVAIKEALARSPWNIQYLCELGAIESALKHWPEALAAFKDAEGRAGLVPEEKVADLGRARRGQGYVLVEMGQLKEAEKIYLRCIEANSKDDKARRELEYVRDRLAKEK